MELKLILVRIFNIIEHSLNRTFYGIETRVHDHGHAPVPVLIVPFMELKLHSPNRRKRKPRS